jgi:hypothetical protein
MKPRFVFKITAGLVLITLYSITDTSANFLHALKFLYRAMYLCVVRYV